MKKKKFRLIERTFEGVIDYIEKEIELDRSEFLNEPINTKKIDKSKLIDLISGLQDQTGNELCQEEAAPLLYLEAKEGVVVTFKDIAEFFSTWSGGKIRDEFKNELPAIYAEA